MPLFDRFIELATVVTKLTEFEKRQTAASKELREDVASLRAVVAGLENRVVVLETRLSVFETSFVAQAAVAARAAATEYAGDRLMMLAERITRLESTTPNRPLLPPA